MSGSSARSFRQRKTCAVSIRAPARLSPVGFDHQMLSQLNGIPISRVLDGRRLGCNGRAISCHGPPVSRGQDGTPPGRIEHNGNPPQGQAQPKDRHQSRGPAVETKPGRGGGRGGGALATAEGQTTSEVTDQAISEVTDQACGTAMQRRARCSAQLSRSATWVETAKLPVRKLKRVSFQCHAADDIIRLEEKRCGRTIQRRVCAPRRKKR